MSTMVVTGAAGFIGCNYVHARLRQHPSDRVIAFDALTYAGNPENLQDLSEGPSYRFVQGDIGDQELVMQIFSAERPDYVVHFAAESHVDRSILGPQLFTQTNVLGTHILLEAARKIGVRRFIQVSTDEVYGALGPKGAFSEESALAPSSPYSASKAGADMLALAYAKTFGLDVVITRCSNNYGPYQFPEKLIPLMVINALENKPLPVYGDGKQVRDWIHVQDHCRALDQVLERGRSGEVYNVGGRNEHDNLSVIRTLLRHLGRPESLIKYVADRPGHDRRYAVDPGKIERELGFMPERSFEIGLAETIDWYLNNKDWWGRIRTGVYREYYLNQYGR